MVNFLMWFFLCGCLLLMMMCANLLHDNGELEHKLLKKDGELTELRIENEDLRYKLNFKVPSDDATVKFEKE